MHVRLEGGRAAFTADISPNAPIYDAIVQWAATGQLQPTALFEGHGGPAPANLTYQQANSVLRILIDGCRIKLTDTPAALQMQDDDVVDVMIGQGGPPSYPRSEEVFNTTAGATAYYQVEVRRLREAAWSGDQAWNAGTTQGLQAQVNRLNQQLAQAQQAQQQAEQQAEQQAQQQAHQQAHQQAQQAQQQFQQQMQQEEDAQQAARVIQLQQQLSHAQQQTQHAQQTATELRTRVHTLQKASRKAQREQRREEQQRAASQARTSQLAKLRTRQQAAPNFTLNAQPEEEEEEEGEEEEEEEVATPGSPPAPRRSSRTPLPVTRFKASPAPPPTKLRRAMQETSAAFGLPSEL